MGTEPLIPEVVEPAAVAAEGLERARIDRYNAEGFLLLRGLFSEGAVASFNQRFVDLVASAELRSGRMHLMQDVMVAKGAVAPQTPLHGVNKLMSFEEDPVLFEFVRTPALLGAVRSLIGRNLHSLSTNVFNKPPGVDGRHPLHQDLRYFRLRPAAGIIGVWTALLPVDRRNGALAVIPRSHRGELLEHGYPDWDYVNRGFYGVKALDLAQRVHVEMAPGDTLLFHPLLIHGSGRNRSDRFRRAISVHYAADDCTSPPPDWRAGELVRRIPDTGEASPA